MPADAKNVRRHHQSVTDHAEPEPLGAGEHLDVKCEARRNLPLETTRAAVPVFRIVSVNSLRCPGATLSKSSAAAAMEIAGADTGTTGTPPGIGAAATAA